MHKSYVQNIIAMIIVHFLIVLSPSACIRSLSKEKSDARWQCRALASLPRLLLAAGRRPRGAGGGSPEQLTEAG